VHILARDVRYKEEREQWNQNRVVDEKVEADRA
jgi:hypothetical protein